MMRRKGGRAHTSCLHCESQREIFKLGFCYTMSLLLFLVSNLLSSYELFSLGDSGRGMDLFREPHCQKKLLVEERHQRKGGFQKF